MLEHVETTAPARKSGLYFHRVRTFVDPVALTIFDRALRALGLVQTAPIAKRRTLAGLLNKRVTRQAIQNWRKGRRKAPAWARAIIAAELRKRIAEYEHLAALLENPEAKP